MSKLSFRARALDASKPMPIFMAEELPDLPDYSAINRAVPQMPSGMEKEEECEHHLQRAICAGLIIPTPEVNKIPDEKLYSKAYPGTYKQPRQLIRMLPFGMEQDVPDYDMDSEDEHWYQEMGERLNLTEIKFEQMMDKLEKSSGQTVISLNEAKALLKEDDDLTISIFDYWLNKRLRTQQPLIPTVKTEHRAGIAANNPYLAFRRRTEKMQTRKNRKNDEVSYEKMLKLKRDLYRAVTLLEFIKRREKMKREHVHLTIEVFEKRFQAKDFNGAILNEVSSIKSARPAFTPIFQNHYTNQSWASKSILKDEGLQRKEKRQYKKRKHKPISTIRTTGMEQGIELVGLSDEEDATIAEVPEAEDNDEDGPFAFRRNKHCSYHMPHAQLGNWPWCSEDNYGPPPNKKFRYCLTSISNNSQKKRCIGLARRRMGRGGRVILDRASSSADDEFWRSLDFTITGNNSNSEVSAISDNMNCLTNNIVKSETNNFNNSINASLVKNLQSECKSELGGGSTRTNEINDIHVREEPIDLGVSPLDTSVNVDKCIEEDKEYKTFLQTIRKEWLHFRPKTPPPGTEPVCNLQPAEESYWTLGSSSAFSVEIQTIDPPSALLDSSVFVTDTFTFDNLDSLDIPITDTRQTSDKIQTGINLNVNVGINTLTANITNDNSTSNVNHVDDHKFDSTNDIVDSSSNNDKTIGCSTFYVSDVSANSSASLSKTPFSMCTVASPKLNSITSVSDGQLRPNADNNLGSTNGILPQFGYDKSTGRTKNNKLSYAYTGGMEFTNTTPGISLHTSAHTLTLNSHSANIFEIPITNNTDTISNDLVNSPRTETGGTSASNKNKTIARKNNLVMEVT